MQEGSSSEVSHGICARCIGVTEGLAIDDLKDVQSTQLDALPFGAIRVTEDGTIEAYNATESTRFGYKPDEVVGRSFFADIAPCTAVQEFKGRFDALVQSGTSGRASLSFVFCIGARSELVDVVLLWDAHVRRGTLLISAPL